MLIIVPYLTNLPDLDYMDVNKCKLEYIKYVDNYCEKCQPMLIKRNGKIVPMKRRKFNEYRQILLKRGGKE